MRIGTLVERVRGLVQTLRPASRGAWTPAQDLLSGSSIDPAGWRRRPPYLRNAAISVKN